MITKPLSQWSEELPVSVSSGASARASWVCPVCQTLFDGIALRIDDPDPAILLARMTFEDHLLARHPDRVSPKAVGSPEA